MSQTAAITRNSKIVAKIIVATKQRSSLKQDKQPEIIEWLQFLHNQKIMTIAMGMLRHDAGGGWKAALSFGVALCPLVMCPYSCNLFHNSYHCVIEILQALTT